MTRQQKLIIAILSGGAVLVMAALACAAFLLLTSRPSRPVAAQPPAAATPAPTLPATATPAPTLPATATPTPTPTALPSPTSTRVVTITVEPTPKQVLNCINNITDFEASGLITNEQVQEYLRQAVPEAHLDNCRIIRYIPQHVSVRSVPAAGKFIPLFRHISVYAAPPEYHNREELLNTLVHEIGHNAYFNMRMENEELAERWIELYRQDGGFVSDYARTHELEDFAESYMFYVRDPAVLRQASPAKYEYIRVEFFAGREY